jgi:hypothetical protein
MLKAWRLKVKSLTPCSPAEDYRHSVVMSANIHQTTQCHIPTGNIIKKFAYVIKYKDGNKDFNQI